MEEEEGGVEKGPFKAPLSSVRGWRASASPPFSRDKLNVGLEDGAKKTGAQFFSLILHARECLCVCVCVCLPSFSAPEIEDGGRKGTHEGEEKKKQFSWKKKTQSFSK